MSTELATQESQVVAVRGDNIQVTASSSDEMAQSQTALIAWSERKIATMEAEASELREAFEHAKKMRWRTVTLERHWKLAEKRVEFYQKLKAALEAGYIIVPSFPVEVFAVRSAKDKPTRHYLTNTSQWASRKQECAATLPSGKGEYVNPVEHVYVEKTQEKNAQGHDLYAHFTFGQWADLDFPINMAKPQIMEATTRAMALKIFDDFGVLPGTRKNIDPIIVARIRDPRVPHRFAPKMISFIIKWHLDTATL